MYCLNNKEEANLFRFDMCSTCGCSSEQDESGKEEEA